MVAVLVLSSARAFAAPQALRAAMSGGQETPPNGSTAAGTCSASIDPAILQVTFSGTFAGLAAQASAASLRGLAGPGSVAPALRIATTLTAGLSGSFSGSGTLTPDQASGMLAGQANCEIDDTAFSSGELRGQLIVSSTVPALAPWGVGCLAALLACAGVVSRRPGNSRVAPCTRRPRWRP